MAKKPKGSVSGGSGSPEKKSGKKGQETTDEDQQQSNKVSEVDKEWFQIQMRSLEEKLERRNERMKQLELRTKEYQERFDELREDKADVVAYLKRTLMYRTDQISELQARLEGLQQVHETDGITYKKRLSDMEAEFARTKEQLASENMVLTKKLDALEEFRIQREQLMARFEEQESKIESQKGEYEGRIYDLEKRHVQEEDRLKKDMMNKLESVAAEFRKASHAQMSATTQRTIRENINVSAQIMQLSERAAELALENDHLMEQDRNKCRQIELLESEQRNLIRQSSNRMKVIEELLAKCKSQDEMLAGLDKYKSQRRVYEKKVSNLKGEIAKLNNKLGKDALVTKEREAAISDMNKKLKGVSKTKEIINVCLSEASISIRTALALESDPTGAASSAEDSKAHREGVLNQLLVLLNKAVHEGKKTKSGDTAAVDESGGDLTKALEDITRAGGGPGGDGTDALDAAHDDAATGDRADPIDYLHGSLGLVPMSDE